ncbi:hypothetical protein V1478_008356 [Vespula squamosa]|uniref:Uncharacterized protein n=1 Tax=Vespula squamosa TaxID=30214 RepID=A0ABD2AT92_VESSQ
MCEIEVLKECRRKLQKGEIDIIELTPLFHKLLAKLEWKVHSIHQRYKLLLLQVFEKPDYGERVNITKDVI